MKIRRAKPEDAEEIYKFRIDTIEKINSKDYTQNEIDEFKKLYSKKVIVEKIKSTDMFCIIDNKIIGTIYLQGNKIGGLFIKSDYINKGIGTKLLKFIEYYAKNKGIKKVKLFSTRTAYNFYLKQGYKPAIIIKEDLPLTKYFNKKLEKKLS